MNNILKNIKSKEWFLGVRPEESLLGFSLKGKYYQDYIKSQYGIPMIEAMVVPTKGGLQVRAFNRHEAENFHKVSRNKLKSDPGILNSYLDENEATWEEILSLVDKLKAISELNKVIIEELIKLNQIAAAQFFIIYSLGMELEKIQDREESAGRILERHNSWRNSVTFDEEAVQKAVTNHLQVWQQDQGLDISLLTTDEVLDWISGNAGKQEIYERIKSRDINGYIFLSRPQENLIIDDQEAIDQIAGHFENIDSKQDTVDGVVAYKGDEDVIKGKIIIVRDKAELEQKKDQLKGKILVTRQTTPHFFPYLNDVKAIITDEGGITCHAAIISREMQKPCIIGTGNATICFCDGDRVIVALENNTEICKI